MQNDLKPCPFCGGEGHMKDETIEKWNRRAE